MIITLNSLMDYGNLAIGFGTFVLAMVLGIINYRNSNRDRKVHVADKRQDWLVEFRNAVSEFLVAIDAIKFSNLDSERTPLEKTNELKEIFRSSDRIMLLMNNDYPESEKLLKCIDELVIKIPLNLDEGWKLVPEFTGLSKKIMEYEWEKIKELKD